MASFDKVHTFLLQSLSDDFVVAFDDDGDGDDDDDTG